MIYILRRMFSDRFEYWTGETWTSERVDAKPYLSIEREVEIRRAILLTPFDETAISMRFVAI